MRHNKSILQELIYLALCAIACLVPMVWVSLPAAAILLLWLPGRSIVRILKPVSTTPGAAWSALAASLVLMPVPLSWLWHVTNDRFAILSLIVAINAILMLFAHRTAPQTDAPPMFPTATTRRIFTALVLYSAGCVFCFYWLPVAAGRLAINPSGDYIKHHAVILSLEQNPLPLHNIFYAAEADTPYYYYEYHHLLPATLRILSGYRAPISLAFGLTSAAVTAAFIALVFLLARSLLDSTRGAIFAAACVSIVGGWDIIPVLIRAALTGSFVVVMDAWCPVAWRIHNIADNFIWCPQHVAALVALLLCCRWLQCVPLGRAWVVIAPLIAASIFGSSVYQAMTFFLAAAIYVILRFLKTVMENRTQAFRLLLGVSLVAVLGLLLMGSKAWQYHLMSGRFPGGLTLQWERFPFAGLSRFIPPGPLANLLEAPWLILVDFGLTAIACVFVARVVWATFWKDAGMRLLILAGAISLAAMFTIRSNVNAIDYSFRAAVMSTNVVAAICAGALLDRSKLRAFARAWVKPVLIVGVVLGLPVGFYEAPVMAIRTMLQKKYVFQDLQAVRFLQENTPTDAVIQAHPQKRLALPQLLNRQMGVLDPNDPHINVFRPLDQGRMHRAMGDIEQAFSTDSSREAYEKFRAWGVTHVLAGSIERRSFGELNQFNDPAFFKMVYNDHQSAVYRLVDLSDSQPSN